MKEKIKDDILAIRDTGLTNMLDVKEVQRIANEMDFYELVIFTHEHKEEYFDFILYGK